MSHVTICCFAYSYYSICYFVNNIFMNIFSNLFNLSGLFSYFFSSPTRRNSINDRYDTSSDGCDDNYYFWSCHSSLLYSLVALGGTSYFFTKVELSLVLHLTSNISSSDASITLTILFI